MSTGDLAAATTAARLGARTNSKYDGNYIRFCKWVDEQVDCSVDAHGRYITRDNVDKYFSRAIPNFCGNSNVETLSNKRELCLLRFEECVC